MGVQMTPPSAPAAIPPLFLADQRTWLKRESDILSGAVIPHAGDRCAGHGCFQDSALLDLRQVITIELARDMLPRVARQALDIAHDVPTADNCWTAYRETLLTGDFSRHLLFHAAIRGLSDAISTLAMETLGSRRPHEQVAWIHQAALVVGLMSLHRNFRTDDGLEAEDTDDARGQGFARLRQLGTLANNHELVREWLESEQEAGKQAATGLEAVFAEIAKPVPEPEIADEIPYEREPERGLVVIGDMPTKDPNKFRQELLTRVKSIVGKSLPLVGTERLAEVRNAVLESHPHCADVIDRVLNPQVGKPYFHGNYLLVGNRGSGKSSLARAIASAVGLPITVINGATEADASFGGTPFAYGTAGISKSLQLIARGGVANPVVGIDELEKAATGRTNGNFLDALLSFTEPGTAAAYEDPALQVPVNLSAVSYFCTANSLEGIPEPLLDRLTVIRVPDPTWQHIGSLTQRILADIATNQGRDPRWVAGLSRDELEIIKQAWPGGSLRRLRKVLEVFVENRERAMGMN
ncbi:AAA family ATPase [Devosia sp. 1566]|uniref:AAA family ATPase n=1 Tax=Devosia sp. 1566 TaxID=2499144 RepID=UPI000FD6EEBC|nr:AAA family ATPase [Devosia sp. 1566]